MKKYPTFEYCDVTCFFLFIEDYESLLELLPQDMDHDTLLDGIMSVALTNECLSGSDEELATRPEDTQVGGCGKYSLKKKGWLCFMIKSITTPSILYNTPPPVISSSSHLHLSSSSV